MELFIYSINIKPLRVCAYETDLDKIRSYIMILVVLAKLKLLIKKAIWNQSDSLLRVARDVLFNDFA